MRLLTAGESHGKGLVGILEGLPSGAKIDIGRVNAELARRQGGYGRGGRMKIETDTIEVLSGLNGGVTLASPLAYFIKNRDYENWTAVMSPETGDISLKKLTRVRPGHADLTGVKKYGFGDNARPVLERASARETAARVAGGAICRQVLEAVGVTISSRVLHICGITDTAEQRAAIDEAMRAGDTLGGEAEITVKGMPLGVGSYVQYDRRLDALYAFHLMGINAVKAVGVGMGRDLAYMKGSEAHDCIYPDGRRTNRAGGLEGGMSNGEDIVLTAAFKPRPTLMKNGLATVDLATGEPASAAAERSDCCVMEAAAVVAENVVALATLTALLDTFGGDTLEELRARTDERRAK